MRRVYLLAFVLTLAGAAAAETFTASDGAKITYTPAPAVANPPPPPPPVVPPVVPGPLAFAVYKDGAFSWQGDYSYPKPPLTIDLKDKSGSPPSGTFDIRIMPNGGQWPAWQPFANDPQQSWSTAGLKALVFKLKPTAAGQGYHVLFLYAHDVSTNCPVELAPKYGPAPVQGVWASYSIPLSDLCVAGKDIYKFAVQQYTGSADWFMADVGFTK